MQWCTMDCSLVLCFPLATILATLPCSHDFIQASMEITCEYAVCSYNRFFL